MDRAGRWHWGPILVAATLTLIAAPAASAHVVRTVGPYTVEMGWGNEPPVAGFENLVEVTVTRDPGGPVADLGPDAAVAVSFGDAHKQVPLLATEEPGEFHAALVPTRPGTYAFQVEATVDGRQISTGAKCSEGTFDCVVGASEVQFPVADPTAGEVADRLSRALPRAEAAADDADSAKRLAITAIAIAAIAMGGAVAVALRARRNSRE